ncbi:MAG: WG repeat-containing protein, partial [Bacteroidota bacterium]
LRKAGKYGLLDEDRTVMIDFLYDDLLVPPGQYPDSFLREGLLAVKQDSLWGFINFREKQVIPFRYDQVEPFEDGYARVKYQGKWGYINRRGVDYFEE